MSKELLTQIIQKAMRQQINPLIFEEVRIEQSAPFDLLKEASKSWVSRQRTSAPTSGRIVGEAPFVR